MLEIRNEQMQVLNKVVAHERLLRFAHRLQERDARLTPDAAQTLARTALEKAEACGASNEESCWTIARIVAEWGTDFDQTQEWATAILGWRGVNAQQRFTALRDHAIAAGLKE